MCSGVVADSDNPIDPVCGMQVQTANAPAHRSYRGNDAWFCSDRCAQRFEREPEKYLQGGGGVDDGGHDDVPVTLGLAGHRHEVNDAED